jgi:hypothetical protein
MNGSERIEHGRLRLFQFRDGERLGANARFSMLLRNHRKRLLPAAPTVFSSGAISRLIKIPDKVLRLIDLGEFGRVD